MADIDDSVSLYDLLSVARDASHDDIKRAYRRYSTVLHPDKQTDDVLKEEASAYFVQIKEAYEVRRPYTGQSHASRSPDAQRRVFALISPCTSVATARNVSNTHSASRRTPTTYTVTAHVLDLEKGST